jgi:hypothetical protein
VQQTLCTNYVTAAGTAVLNGSETRAVGVVEILVDCLQLIDQAEFNAGITDPATKFGLALGNIFACDKISNSVLTLGEFSEDGNSLCQAIVQGT